MNALLGAALPFLAEKGIEMLDPRTGMGIVTGAPMGNKKQDGPTDWLGLILGGK
jgi:hypothetical protein